MTFDLYDFLRAALVCAFGLCYVLTLCKWRYPLRRTLLLYGAFLGGALALNAALRLLWWNFGAELLFRLLCVAATLLFGFLNSRYRDGRAAFISLTATLFVIIGGTLSGLLTWHWEGEIWEALGELLIFPLLGVYLFWLRDYFIDMMRSVPSGWGKLSVIPLAFYWFLISLVYLPVSLRLRSDNIPTVIMLVIMVFIVYSSFSTVFRKLQQNYDLKQENTVMNLRLNHLKDRIGQTELLEGEMKKFRHDIRHYTRILSSCLSNGEIAEAQRILEKLDAGTAERLRPVFPPLYSGDPAVNAVLSFYCDRSRELGIDLCARLDLPEGSPVDSMELSVMLSNALENAVNACGRIPDGEPKSIRVSGAPANGQFLICVSNSCRDPVAFDPDDGTPTTSRAGHGIGSRSIAAFARKNHAQLDYSLENGIFKLSILL